MGAFLEKNPFPAEFRCARPRNSGSSHGYRDTISIETPEGVIFIPFSIFVQNTGASWIGRWFDAYSIQGGTWKSAYLVEPTLSCFTSVPWT